MPVTSYSGERFSPSSSEIPRLPWTRVIEASSMNEQAEIVPVEGDLMVGAGARNKAQPARHLIATYWPPGGNPVSIRFANDGYGYPAREAITKRSCVAPRGQ